MLNFTVSLNNQIIAKVGRKPGKITDIKPPMLTIIFPIAKNHC